MAEQEFQQQIKVVYENESARVVAECGDKADFDSIKTATCHFYERLDSTITDALVHVEEGIDCKHGCSYCCHFRVDVSANEVFTITDYVQSTFAPDKLAKLIERANNNKSKFDMLSQSKRMVTNVACPLLEDNACSIYAIRPSMCRKMHSTNVAACKHSYDNPEDNSVENAEHPVLSAIIMMVITAAQDGFSKSGLDKTVYDMNQVLSGALTDAKYKKRWLNGKKAFP